MKKRTTNEPTHMTGEPSKRHRPLTASHRRERAEKHKALQSNQDSRKNSINEFKKKIMEEFNHDENNDNVVEFDEFGDYGNEEGSEEGEEEKEDEEGGDDESDNEEGGDDEGDDEEGDYEDEKNSDVESDNEEGFDDEYDNEEGSDENEDGVDDEEEGDDEDDDYPLYEKEHDHVAYYLLKKIDRGPLKCKQYTGKIKRWDLSRESEEIRTFIKETALYCLRDGSYRTANRVFASAFVERWHPETTTFHMPFGEVTITLDDVQKLLNIPFKGKPMTINLKSIEISHHWVSELLGIPSKIVYAEFHKNKGKLLRTQWIIDHLSIDGPNRYNASPEQVIRGYMLVLIGCTLFQDRTGNKVLVKYLFFLENLEKINRWAWGAGALSFLYRSLGKASTFKTRGLCGYLTLLEAWIYERFPRFRPHFPLKVRPTAIITKKWKPTNCMRDIDAIKNLKYVRGELDNMTKEDFVWTPYRERNEKPHVIAWFNGCLVLDKILEPYHPGRVVRQFGYVQAKPKHPIKPKFASRKKAKAYIERYYNRPEEFKHYQSHLLPKELRGCRATEDGQCTAEYIEWYTSRALIRLNLEHPTSIFHAPECEEVNWLKKVIETTEGYVKKGMKMTKPEFNSALKNILSLLKEGVCGGKKAVEAGESSRMQKKKSIELVEPLRRKSNPGVVIVEPSSTRTTRPRNEVNQNPNDKGKGVLVMKQKKK